MSPTTWWPVMKNLSCITSNSCSDRGASAGSGGPRSACWYSPCTGTPVAAAAGRERSAGSSSIAVRCTCCCSRRCRTRTRGCPASVGCISVSRPGSGPANSSATAAAPGNCRPSRRSWRSSPGRACRVDERSRGSWSMPATRTPTCPPAAMRNGWPRGWPSWPMPTRSWTANR